MLIYQHNSRKEQPNQSHPKSIVDKKTWLDLPMRYQPYHKFSDWLIHMFLR